MASKIQRNNRKTALEILQSPEFLARICDCKLSWLERVIENTSEFYITFEKPKKDGTPREITPPTKKLRFVQYRIMDLLYSIIPVFSQRVCGGLKGRSIRKHASYHLQKQLLVTMDVSNFFPTTTIEMVSRALEQVLNPESSRFIASLCTYNSCLPQGSPTSMLLANMCFLPIDRKMISHCKYHKLDYSRYVDDIAISGDINFESHIETFSNFIMGEGYEVATKKTKILPQGQEQIVTGLVVNCNMRPTKEYISTVRKTIEECLEVGVVLEAARLGLTVGALKSKLNGKVRYILGFDKKHGSALKRKLYQLWLKEKATISCKADAIGIDPV